jgi:hypothetical protein
MKENRLGEAIVLMIIVLMWTLTIFAAIWLAFAWMADSFGRDVAVVTMFALGGVTLAIVLWVASSRHTTAIWRSALNYAADTQDASVTALRSLSSVQREDARTHRLREQGRVQIEVASYKAALTDARQEMRQQDRQATPAQTWAMAEEDGEGGDFRWSS